MATSCEKCEGPLVEGRACVRCAGGPVGGLDAVEAIARTLGASPVRDVVIPPSRETTFPPGARPFGAEPTLPPKPGTPLSLPSVPRETPQRRPWLLLGLLAALSLLLLDQSLERERARQSASASRQARSAERIDGAYLSLAIDTLLGECRREDALERREELEGRVQDLRSRLPRAAVSPRERESYAQALLMLESFLEEQKPELLGEAQRVFSGLH